MSVTGRRYSGLAKRHLCMEEGTRPKKTFLRRVSHIHVGWKKTNLELALVWTRMKYWACFIYFNTEQYPSIWYKDLKCVNLGTKGTPMRSYISYTALLKIISRTDCFMCPYKFLCKNITSNCSLISGCHLGWIGLRGPPWLHTTESVQITCT